MELRVRFVIFALRHLGSAIAGAAISAQKEKHREHQYDCNAAQEHVHLGYPDLMSNPPPLL